MADPELTKVVVGSVTALFLLFVVAALGAKGSLLVKLAVVWMLATLASGSYFGWLEGVAAEANPAPISTRIFDDIASAAGRAIDRAERFLRGEADPEPPAPASKGGTPAAPGKKPAVGG